MRNFSELSPTVQSTIYSRHNIGFPAEVVRSSKWPEKCGWRQRLSPCIRLSVLWLFFCRSFPVLFALCVFLSHGLSLPACWGESGFHGNGTLCLCHDVSLHHKLLMALICMPARVSAGVCAFLRFCEILPGHIIQVFVILAIVVRAKMCRAQGIVVPFRFKHTLYNSRKVCFKNSQKCYKLPPSAKYSTSFTILCAKEIDTD